MTASAGVRERWLRLEDLDLCVFEWGEVDAPTVVLLHATGFHGRCWDAVAEQLAFEYRVLAPDMRGHGRSGKQPPFTWKMFTHDIEQMLEQLGVVHAVGIGHSMGGHCMVGVAARQSGVLDRLVLVDPVILPPEFYAMGESTHGRMASVAEDLPVARRRNRWKNWQEMVAHLREREPFSNWRRRVLEDYCRYGLLAAEDGYTLACPPLVEASIYMGNTKTDVYERLADVDIPVLVMRGRQSEMEEGRMNFSNSPTWPELASRFPQGRDLYLPRHSHFIPMEDPELIVMAVREPESLSGDPATTN
ncbi:MAG: alpha/beta hydrolase [Pseudomonadales bacterium]|nr:alpha/beta hydrolase [Pseudomonadales bacterium]MDP6470288.1 alpha/beta hydrolase [Pseudomonadales bacterium]MDP6827194.1 alpha/beta hydrolase [Pseudomonadales bacterium]MDP6972503.1 alpha/beta hydrolase [Pseudomonadales bacterium]